AAPDSQAAKQARLEQAQREAILRQVLKSSQLSAQGAQTPSLTLTGQAGPGTKQKSGGETGQPGLGGIASSGSAAIRTQTPSYRTYTMGFEMSRVSGLESRLDLTGRVLNWIYPEAANRVSGLSIGPEGAGPDSLNAVLAKIISFVTSANGALSAGDSVKVYFELPAGYGITYSTALSDSLQVAVGEGGFTPSSWAELIADTLIFTVPVDIGADTLVRVRVASFSNPSQPGRYAYGLRTSSDAFWARDYMNVVRPLPTVTVDISDDFSDGHFSGWTTDFPDGWEVVDGAMQQKSRGEVTDNWLRYYATLDNGGVSGDFTLTLDIGFNENAYPMQSEDMLSTSSEDGYGI
ncbi:MAG TPA: hypothetical protein VJ417_04710, partial [Candidatus Glassbacteria bacterium]|nr:hypothetical protein [Candidatus Glassbacteria bacterium]